MGSESIAHKAEVIIGNRPLVGFYKSDYSVDYFQHEWKLFTWYNVKWYKYYRLKKVLSDKSIVVFTIWQ